MLLNKQNLYILYSFIAGFSLMTIEIISSRIMAPIIGNSVYTWSSVIGITLLGLAIGSSVGGIMADKFNNTKILPFIFFISAICVFIIIPLSKHTDWITNFSNSIIFINILLSIYFFLVPAIAIGLIQPVILKKYAIDFSKIGYKYGLLSTAWSLGSILGVFITGFYFISTIGSLKTILVIGFLLLFLSILISLINKEKKTLYIIIISILIFLFSLITFRLGDKSNTVYNQESNYYMIRVVDFNKEPYGQTRALVLDFDTHSIESEKLIESAYTEIYPAFKIFKSDLKDILVIGGGAYTLPKHLKSFYPDSNVSVIEIDPEIEKVANTFFKLNSNIIKTINGDARFLINKNDIKYDLIYGDAYNSFISVPGQLLTKEYNDKIKNSLNPNGLYALNFIGSLVGKNSDLFKSVTNTFKESFPNYYIFAFSNNRPSQIQSITLIGINNQVHQPESVIKEALKKKINPFLAEKIILSSQTYTDKKALILKDDFYPTEKLTANTIKYYFPYFLSFMREIL